MSHIIFLVQIIILLFRSEFIYSGSFIPQRPNAANKVRVRTNVQGRLARVVTRSNFRESNFDGSKKKLLEKIESDNKEDQIPRIIPNNDGIPVFEMYVRSNTNTINNNKKGKIGTIGPWIRYCDVKGDDSLKEENAMVLQGGLEEELHRINLEEWISKKIFGTGMGGDKKVIEDLKKTLPKLKKLKPRDFEFGYRLLADGQMIYILNKIINNSKDNRDKKDWIQDRLPTTPIDIFSLIEEYDNGNMDALEMESMKAHFELMKAWSKSLLSKMKELDTKHCIICSDGSAVISPKGCIDASAGLICIPVVESNINSFHKNVMINENNLDKTNTNTAVPSGDGYGQQLERNYGHINMNHAFPLRVIESAGLVKTPFDVELVAGLAAMTVCKFLYNEAEKDVDILSLQVFTDSRSLLKAYRSGLYGDKNVHRTAIWELIYNLSLIDIDVPVTKYEAISDNDNKDGNKNDNDNHENMVNDSKGDGDEIGCGDDDGLELQLEMGWTPGHPERREANSTKWTLEDRAIFAADRIAKGEWGEEEEEEEEEGEGTRTNDDHRMALAMYP